MLPEEAGMKMQVFRVGIDPGERYVGIALVRIDAPQAVLVALTTVDLYGTGAKKSLKDLLAGRAGHRRMRRTLKSARRRLGMIRAILEDAGASDEDRRLVLGLCRRRGWRPDIGSSSAEKVLSRLKWDGWGRLSDASQDKVWAALAEVRDADPEAFAVHRRAAVDQAGLKPGSFDKQVDEAAADDDEAAVRVPRRQVLDEIDRLICEYAPSVPEPARAQIRRLLERPPKAHGLNNKKVATCGTAGGGCKSKRCRGVDYPGLWLAQTILNQIPRRRKKDSDDGVPDFDKVREAFIRNLRAHGLPVDDLGRNAKAFRRRDVDAREKDYKVVCAAWKKASAKAGLSQGLVQNIKRFLDGAKKQIKGANTATRLALCPDHLHKSVLCLAWGGEPAAAGGRGGMHSITWEAVAAKIAVHVREKLLPLLPPGARIERIVIERDAFDLMSMRSKGGKKGAPSQKIPDEVRWLGPYGQLRSLVEENEKTDTLALLALEVGGLCALCGNPLGGDIDRAHLIPRDDVGGYPYLAVVAAHHRCNRNMGSRVARIAPAAVEAMEEVRDKIKKKHGMVHAWLSAKYGLLNLLSREEPDEARVRKYLGKAFTTREATMQGADVLGDSAREAVRRAGFGDPEVVKRGATEIAGARWIACTPQDEDDPWFVKASEKEQGDVTNHAMDAFIAAALPNPEKRFWRNGQVRWGIHRVTVRGRLAVLASREKWEAALEQAWQGKDGYGALGIMELTFRRIWAQAFVRDTQVRPGNGEHGEYRIGAETWLEKLRTQKKTRRQVAEHIEGIRFGPLKTAAAEALGKLPEDAPHEEVYAAVKAAVVGWLKASTLAGLRGAPRSVFHKHPVVARRLEELKRWAQNKDPQGPVPVWIGFTTLDRWSGGRPVRIRGKLSRFNLESWAQAKGRRAAGVKIEAYRSDGGRVEYVLELDGSLRPLSDGAPPLDCCRMAALVEKSRPVLGPFLAAWRAEAGAVLAQAGFVRASLVDFGTGKSLNLALPR